MSSYSWEKHNIVGSLLLIIHQYSINSLLCGTTAAVWTLLSTWLNWQVTNQPVGYALFPILLFSVFPLCARTRLVRDLFLMLHRMSGTVSHSKIDYETHSHLLNHLWNLTSSSYPIDSVCACVRACVRVCVCVHALTEVWTVFWFFAL